MFQTTAVPPAASAGISPAPIHDKATGSLPSLTAVANASPPELLAMIERGVPRVTEAIFRLPQKDIVSAAGTCTRMRHAMAPFRRDAEKLYESAAMGAETVVQRLVQKGVPVDWAFNADADDDRTRETALIAAVRKNEAGVVKCLVRASQFDPTDTASAEALRAAVALCPLKEDPFSRFIGADPVLRDTPQLAGDAFFKAWLDAGAEFRQAKVNNIVQLLSHGVPITSLSDEQWEDCWRALWQVGGAIPYLLWHPKAIERIFKFEFPARQVFEALTGEQLQTQDPMGRTVVHWCAMALEPKGYVNLLDNLCRSHTYRDVPDRAERTPLHYAAAEGNHESTRILLSHDADPIVRDIDGFTPLDEALIHDKGSVANVLTDYIARDSR